MCLVIVAWKTIPDTRLRCVGNRDEFYTRPTQALHQWQNGIVAGQDLVAKGTWMGIHATGRFAVVTNFRDGSTGSKAAQQSRGKLISDFLLSKQTPAEYASTLVNTATQYDGYNLLFSDLDTLYHFSNVQGDPLPLEPGHYAVSNHLLDTPWPKVIAAKERLAAVDFRETESLEIMRDEARPPGPLPSTGIDPELEVALSPIFVRADSYGTRASSWVSIGEDSRGVVYEKNFDKTGGLTGETRLEIHLT
ncbi:MAG: NRDE family protein [Pseudomonadota bacterium]